MNNFILLPVTGAIVSLLCFYAFYTIIISSLKKNKNTLTQEVVNIFKSKLSINGNFDMEPIMPVIQIKIDEFLTKKLPVRMPVIAMFTGEKTNAQLKEIFIEELEEIFPEVMTTYLNNARANINNSQLRLNKVNDNINLRDLLKIIGFSKPKLVLCFSAIGFIIGLVCALISSYQPFIN